jgi:hypothetical protein
MVLRSIDLGCPEIGVVLANMLEAGDIIRCGPLGPVVQSKDIMLRLRALAVHAKVMRLPMSAYVPETSEEEGNGSDCEWTLDHIVDDRVMLYS